MPESKLSVPITLNTNGEIRVITIDKTKLDGSDLIVLLRNNIADQIKENEKIVLDFTNVEYIDAGWLASFTKELHYICQNCAPPVNLSIVIPQKQPKSLFHIEKLDNYFQTFDKLQEAIECLNSLR